MKFTKFNCGLLSGILVFLMMSHSTVMGQITVTSGTYIGNGVDGTTISGIGFQPDVVIVKVSETTNEAQIRTSTMPDGYSRQMVGASAYYLNRIKSFTTDGFVIGDNNDVNNPGKTYYWTAFKANASIQLGTYTGDGTDGRSITGVGFSPDLVFVLPTEGNRASFRTSTFPDEGASAFGSDFNLNNTIEAMLPDGFRIGNEPRANKSGATFHYVAFKAAAGLMKVGSYVGNGIDNRVITGVGFSPVYMFVKSSSNNYATQKSVQMPNSSSIEFTGSRVDDNRIRDFNPDGFVVGTQAQVNNNNTTYHYVCFRNFVPILSINDFAVFGGDQNCPTGPNQTPPTGTAPACRAKLGVGTRIFGNVGSYQNVTTNGAVDIFGNIHSGGVVSLDNSCSVVNITAANAISAIGNILLTGSGASIQGDVSVKGNILINTNAGSFVNGVVTHPAATTYSGPVPGGGEVIDNPLLPVLPPMPPIASLTCPASGSNITGTATIAPGTYGNLILGNGLNQVVTFDGPGNYYFNSIQMGQGGLHKFKYDFKNLPGDIRIYTCDDINMGLFDAILVNNTPDDTCNIYYETQGKGALNGNVYSFILEPGSKFYGKVWAPYAGIRIGSGSGEVFIRGNLWSATFADIQHNVDLIPCAFCTQSITVTKILDGTAPAVDWQYTSDIPGQATFTIPAAGGSVSFNNVPAGNYTITEINQNIPGTSPVRQYSVSNTCGTGNVAGISLAACENKQCLFTNSCQGTLKVIKEFNNLGLPITPPSDWEFTISPAIGGVSTFTLPAAGGFRLFTDVPSGVTYTITESLKEDPTCVASGNFYAVTNSSGTGRVGNISITGCGDSVITFRNSPPECNRCALIVTVNSPSRCESDPAVIVTATPTPAGSYTYVWTVPPGVSNPGNVASFSATVAGTYSVVVSDGGFCNVSASGTLTVNPNPTVTVNSPTRCSSDPAVTITATPTPPGSYNYAWTVPGGVPNPGNVASFSATTAGAYSVVITLVGSSCTGSGSGTLTVNPNPTVTVNSPTRCANDPAATITATPSPSGTYNYAWTVPGGVPDPGNVASFSATVAGAYSVVITNTTTNCTGSGSGTLTVNPNPTVTVNSPTRCSSDPAVTITATPSPSGSYDYAWTVPGGVPNPGNVASFSATTAGTYSVVITNTTTNCTGSGSGTLSVTSNPTVTVNSPSRCADGPAVTITATPTPPGSYNYAWTVPGGVPNPGNVASFSATTAGAYSVVITLVGSSCTGSGSGTLTVNPNPTVTVNSPTRCANDPAATITATPSPSGTYNYAWTVPGGVPNPGNVASFSATVAGTYSVVITNTTTNCTGSGSGTLTVNPNPTVTVNSPTRCSSDPAVTITATPSPSGSYNYAWTVPGGVPNPGNVASFSATTAGTYSVVITNTTTNCTGSGSGTLSVTSNPTVTVNSPSRCADGPAVTITATPSPSGSYNYAWTVPGGVPNPGNVASFSATTAGAYSVVITLVGSTCTGSGSGTLAVNPNPTVTVNSPTRCANDPAATITATPSPSGTYNYAWTVPGGVPNPGNVASFSATVAGAYSVVITNTTTNCTGSGSGTLTVNPNPTVTVNSPTRCSSDPAVTITATPSPSGSYDYAWTVPGGVPNPGNVASFSATTAGTYSVVITNTTTNCTGSGSGTLSVTSNPTVTVNSPSRCADGPAVTITATPTPPGSYNYAWTVPGGVPNPGNVASFSATAAGTYSVVITVIGSTCTGSGSGTLTLSPNPTVTVNSPTRCASGPAVTITATPSPSGSYNYAWTVPGGVPNPGNVASFSATVAGTYSVVITNTTTNCTGSGSGTLTVNPSPTVSVNSPQRCANAPAVTITATPSPSGSYNYAWTVPGGVPNPGNVASFSATTAGTYSVVITNTTTNCTGSGSGILTVNPLPTVTCSADNLAQTLTANPSGGTPPYTYSWNTSPVKTTQTITVTDENLYTVTVTDSKGCTATTSCSVNTCNGFTTVTQGGWGAAPKGNNPAKYLSRKFNQAFSSPDFLTIGCATGNKLRLTSASAIEIFLPSGSTPRALPAGTLVNPTQAYQNVLAGQLVAATLNVRFDDIDPTFSSSQVKLKDLIVNSGPFAGWTVAQVIAEANKLIGGCPSTIGFSAMNNVLDKINNNYDFGIRNIGILSCPGSYPLAQIEGAVISRSATPAAGRIEDDVLVFPNPFRDLTRIRFRSELTDVNGKVDILSTDGKIVATIFNQRVKAGQYYIAELNYPQLPAGMYFYRITIGGKSINGKIVKTTR